MRAAAIFHLGRELLAVRIRVAVRALLLGDMEVELRTRVLVAGRACRGEVLALELERRARMELGTEERRPEACRRVTRLALGSEVVLRELAFVAVGVAIHALAELEPAVSLSSWDARLVTL